MAGCRRSSPGSTRGEVQPHPRLQAAIDDGCRDAPCHRLRPGLTTDEGNIAKTLAMLLGKTGDKRLIAELFPFSHPCTSTRCSKRSKTCPFCQHGEEGGRWRCRLRAARDPVPGNLIQGQKTGGLGLHQQAVAHPAGNRERGSVHRRGSPPDRIRDRACRED